MMLLNAGQYGHRTSWPGWSRMRLTNNPLKTTWSRIRRAPAPR
jgi:hypothetical protein